MSNIIITSVHNSLPKNKKSEEISEYSVTEFIEMTEFAYGGEIIKKLRKFYTEK